MDFDALLTKHNKLQREFDELRLRVMPLLVDHEEHQKGRGTAGSTAEALLNGGKLDDAGKHVGLERSHDGTEPDESYERRIKAHLFGAAKADAEVPRPTDDEKKDDEKVPDHASADGAGPIFNAYNDDHEKPNAERSPHDGDLAEGRESFSEEHHAEEGHQD